MQFVATYWWLWLLGLFSCYAIALFIWYSIIKNTASNFSKTTLNQLENEEFNLIGLHKATGNVFGMWSKSMLIMALSGLVSVVFLILLIISIVISVANMFAT